MFAESQRWLIGMRCGSVLRQQDPGQFPTYGPHPGNVLLRVCGWQCQAGRSSPFSARNLTSYEVAGRVQRVTRTGRWPV
jgi:hypothetical protein